MMAEEKMQIDEEKMNAKPMSSPNKLGEGSYGKVYMKIDPLTNQKTAVKRLKMDKSNHGTSTVIIREAGILTKISSFQHPNLVQIHGINVNSSDQIELEMEFCDSDLANYLKQNRQKLSYDLQIIKQIMWQILNGLSFLHLCSILHRDLKPGNILVKDQQIKITDFGLSRMFSLETRPYSKGTCTLLYCAPELALGIGEYSTGVDIWSVGCIFVELLCLKPMFICKNFLELLYLQMNIFGNFVLGSKGKPGVKYYSKYIPHFQKPNEGMGLKNFLLKNSRFQITNEMYDLISKMLEVDPLKRIQAIDALKHPFFM